MAKMRKLSKKDFVKYVKSSGRNYMNKGEYMTIPTTDVMRMVQEIWDCWEELGVKIPKELT